MAASEMMRQMQQTQFESNQMMNAMGAQLADTQRALAELRAGMAAQSAPAELQDTLKVLLAEVKHKQEESFLSEFKGLSKPATLDGRDDDKVRPWIVKARNWILSLCASLVGVLQWSEDNDEPIDREAIELHFGTGTSTEVKHVHLWNARLHAMLVQVTEKEPFDIVQNCGSGNGFEAWRRLNRRFDPNSGSRRSNLLSSIIKPGRSKLENVLESLERWTDQVRRYESGKNRQGTRSTLDEEIKIFAMGNVVPEELEKH